MRSVASHVWAGSALLFTTTAGDVYYMTPLGRARRVCALPADAGLGGEAGGGGGAALVLAAPDRLVFAQSHARTIVHERTRAAPPRRAHDHVQATHGRAPRHQKVAAKRTF